MFFFFCAVLSAQRQARTSIKSAARVEIKSNAVCLCSCPLFHAPLAGSNQTRQSTSFCKVILLLFHVQSDVGISQEDPFLSETNDSIMVVLNKFTVFLWWVGGGGGGEEGGL